MYTHVKRFDGRAVERPNTQPPFGMLVLLEEAEESPALAGASG